MDNTELTKERIWIKAARITWRWLKRLLISLAVLFFVLSLLLQLPIIQNAVAKRVTTTLSDYLGTTVRVDYINLAFFDKFILRGFYVEDLNCDTLIYSRNLKVDFNTNPIAIIRRGLEVEELSLNEARVFLHKSKGQYRSNIQILIDIIAPANPNRERREGPRNPFRLNVRKVNFKALQFREEDEVRGEHMEIDLAEAMIRVKNMSLPNNQVNIDQVRLISPRVRIEKRERNPLPELIESIDLVPDSLGSAEDSSRFLFQIQDFQLENGQFSLHNYRKSPAKTTPPNVIDYQHLEVFDIDIDIECFSFDQETYKGRVERISLREVSGFELNRLFVEDASISSQAVELNGLQLTTPYSHIGDTLSFSYRSYEDFHEFEDRVNMNGAFNNASVALKDIMVFTTNLENNNFFRNNRNEVLILDGEIRGKVNNLRGKDLNVVLADGTRLKGGFGSRNLGVRNEEFLNLRLERLQTSMRTLRQLIPNFNLPPTFDRLGRLDFNGSFDGFLGDFVAYGDLRTDLGRAEMDMRMDLIGGREKANYSGKLSLQEFNLGGWTGNSSFGLVNFTTEVKDGRGLTAETANAKLGARIQSFNYKGYTYENASLDGELNKNFFGGDFSIRDNNIDFAFRGEVDFTDSIPEFDFNAAVNKLDLQQLNLFEQDFVLAGNIDLNLRNTKSADMEGSTLVQNFRILHNGKDSFLVDSLYASSNFGPDGNKTFFVRSDVLNGTIVGQFDIGGIPDVLMQYFRRNFPEFADRLGIKEKEITKTSYFEYDVEIIDSKGLNLLVDEQLGILQGGRLSGYYHGPQDSLLLDLELPRFIYGEVELIDLVLILDATRDQGDLDLAIDSTVINNSQVLAPITLLSILDRDTLNFGINYQTTSPSLLDNLNLNGKLFLLDSTKYQVRFNQSNLVILENPWAINENNFITFGKKYVETRNFVLTNKARKITLESINEMGLKLSMINFDFDFIDDFWDYDPLSFKGKFNVEAEIGNIFNLSDITAVALADTLFINEDDWGGLRLDAEAVDLKHPFRAYLSITKDTTQILAEGFYNPADIRESEVGALALEKQANYFDFTLSISGYPLNIGEYFIGDMISNTLGSFDANLRLNGLPSKPNISGIINANNGALTIDYLKTRYSFRRALISIDNSIFNATGTILYDKYRHRAVLYGGIRHDHLKDFGLDARLRTQRFLALDTRKGDNKLFYGHALGRGEVRFSGSFQQPDVAIDATVGDSTRIVIPITADRDASELSFIRFVEKHKKEENIQPVDQKDLRGISLEMNLTVTEEANMELVFDEQAGDIIKGTGRGDIRILVPRGRSFQMFGNYVIQEGDYLFTLYGVVNKAFRIKEGGTIQWSGDPFGAQIKLVAEYKGLSTSVANFIAEYLVSEQDADLKNDASKGTEVNLTMQLEGELMHPIINFDIGFPRLSGKLQTYTDSKLRLLKQDQNELNRQVFGLIIIGQFIPSAFAFQGSEIIYNTVSEFVSNQLSLLLTELFSEFIADGTVLSGIDFDINYSQFQNVNLGEGQDITGGDEFQVRLKQNFFNDRLSILVGGNIETGTSVTTAPETSGAFIGNDLIIEYILNKDRSLKLRFYQRLQPDIGGGRRLQFGTGLSFRKEFNSFTEFVKSLKRTAKKAKEPGAQDQTTSTND